MSQGGEDLPAYSDTEDLCKEVGEEEDQHCIQFGIYAPIQLVLDAKVDQKLARLEILLWLVLRTAAVSSRLSWGPLTNGSRGFQATREPGPEAELAATRFVCKVSFGWNPPRAQPSIRNQQQASNLAEWVHQLFGGRAPFPQGEREGYVIDEEKHALAKLINTAELVFKGANDCPRLQPQNPMCPDDPRCAENLPVVTAEKRLRNFAESPGGFESFGSKLVTQKIIAATVEGMRASTNASFGSVAELFAHSTTRSDCLPVAHFLAAAQPEKRGI